MNIEEVFLQGKTGVLNDCEDTYFVNDDFAAVIDGATNVSGERFNGQTPGRLAAKVVKESIASLKGKEDIEEIISIINNNMQELYEQMGIKEKVANIPYYRPSAAMVLFSKYYRKLWLIGDCQVYLNGQLHQNLKIIDEITANARSIVMEAALVKGATVEELLEKDIGLEAVIPLIQQQYYFQNGEPSHPYSYEVINGFPIYLEAVTTIKVEKGVTEICLASDGYPKIFGTLKESEEYLKKLLEIDPLCINENRSAKGLVKGNVSFDDRTYVRVALG